MYIRTPTMIIKIKKRALVLFIPVVILFVVIVLLANSNVVLAACANTDRWAIAIYDSDRVLVTNSSLITMTSTTGTACNVINNFFPNISVSCYRNGTFYANVTCYGCSDHTNVNNTDILTCYAPEPNKFIIRNSTGDNIAAFDEKGYVYLRGFNFSGQTDLSPTPNSYIIRNKTGQTVAYINSTGSLFLTGSISMVQPDFTAPKSSFIIRNSTKKDVAYIDDTGNLVLGGLIYHNWTDPI